MHQLGWRMIAAHLPTGHLGSTVGVLLAKALAMDFVDTDLLIQVREHRPLQQILEAEGYEALRQF